VLSRAVQFFLPGEPQIYYVGLLNGMDDRGLFEQTGQGRDVNRHIYSPAEIDKALESDVTKAILGLVRLRNNPVFEGSFSWQQLSSNAMSLTWQSDDTELELAFKLDGKSAEFEIRLIEGGDSRSFSSLADLAAI